MKVIELLELLTDEAKAFRLDHDYARNSHMHDILLSPTQEQIDAVLVGFINTIGVRRGCDYALYTKDLLKPQKGAA